jgi:hypothetical protein
MMMKTMLGLLALITGVARRFHDALALPGFDTPLATV